MNLDLFTQRFCTHKTPQDFIDSKVGRYLSVVYGPLVYTTEPTVNFLNVHFENNQYVISEGIWYELFPEKEKTGSIIPEKFLNKKFEKNHTGGLKNNISESLSKFGIAFISEDYSNEEKEKMMGIEFSGMYDNVMIPVEYEREIKLRKNTEHIVQELRPFLPIHHENTIKDLYDNQLFKELIHGGHIQKMKKGSRLSPHIDADRGEPIVMSKLYWYFDDQKPIEGRELYFGRRSDEDLAKFIDLVLISNDDFASHTPVDGCTQKGVLKPCLITKVYVTCWNPLFYHGVSEMISDTELITLIEDYTVSECW